MLDVVQKYKLLKQLTIQIMDASTAIHDDQIEDEESISVVLRNETY